MEEIRQALALDCDWDSRRRFVGDARLPSRYRVSDFAAETIAAVGVAAAAVRDALGLDPTMAGDDVVVDRRLASLWFQWSIEPVGWTAPPVWDPIAGLYRTRDGWIRLHTNLPHHRAAACAALGLTDNDALDRDAVAASVTPWDKDALETAIVERGGVAAAMRTHEEWRDHDQGAAVIAEPLIRWADPRPVAASKKAASPATLRPTATRPLAGLKVLDLTRVLAGPVATRTLAGLGAEVLRIDPPAWDEANVAPDITLGKRCAELDLKQPDDLAKLEELLAEADMVIHGYRPDALDRLGLTRARRLEIAPDAIDVALCAYGWTGPWADRRGFDSLVQMSCGIAAAGMDWAQADAPTPLPVQALDHGTGYLMAAAALKALADRLRGAPVADARLSLARTAALVMAHEDGLAPSGADDIDNLAAGEADFQAVLETTPWGPAKRLRPPISVRGVDLVWDRPACDFASSPAVWLSSAH